MNTQLQPPRALKIGDQYSSMQELRLVCKQTAVFDNFKLKVDASDKTRYQVHCISSNTCPWRLHASLVTADGAGNPNTVEIKVFVAEHTCNGHHSSTRHPHTSWSSFDQLFDSAKVERPSQLQSK